MNVAEVLAIGTQHHRSGRLAEAERMYRQVLSFDPCNAQALHLLGMLALQTRQFPAAVELIGRAIRADGKQAAFHANLGEAYRQTGQLQEAVACYRAALKLQGDLTQVQGMLGAALAALGNHAEAIATLREVLRQRPDDARNRMRLGEALFDQGNLAEAETVFRRAARDEPKSAEVQRRLADVLAAGRKFDEAIACYRNALALDPTSADTHNNLGLALNSSGQQDQAAEHYRAALAIQPKHAAALTNLGVVCDAQANFDEAQRCYRAAAEADPSSVVPHYNLGALLEKRGQLDAALASYEAALRIDAKYAAALTAMGQIYQAREQLAAALECRQRVVGLEPHSAEAHNNLGASLNEMGRRDAALACFDTAIRLNDKLAIAHGNRGVALQALGRIDEAIEAHRRAVELAPDKSGLHSNLLYALNYSPRYDAAALAREHRAWGARHAEALTAASLPHPNERASERRLRIGYVSPHFLAHAVNFFVEPIIAHHDRARFEVFCYSDVARGDATTERLRCMAEHWRETFSLGNQQLHDLVREDRIDILVDLTGHIGGGKRMLLFARKPAPVQVTYIGYQNTTGMSAMDYRLTDDYSDPPGATDAFYSEKLVRLPGSFFCYLPSSDAPPVVAPQAQANGFVTFGSFNNFSKVTPEVLDAWCEILSRVKGSRLVILADMVDSLRQRIVETFARASIVQQRLELVDRLPREHYLQLIQRVDIALDPFPFNGHTTTCDCLWQGVGVVTLSGDSYVSRFGGSALATLELGELIAHTREEYVDRAARLAVDPARLAELRQGLRGRMAASRLLDFATFTCNLETEYRQMWTNWLKKVAG